MHETGRDGEERERAQREDERRGEKKRCSPLIEYVELSLHQHRRLSECVQLSQRKVRSSAWTLRDGGRDSEEDSASPSALELRLFFRTAGCR